MPGLRADGIETSRPARPFGANRSTRRGAPRTRRCADAPAPWRGRPRCWAAPAISDCRRRWRGHRAGAGSGCAIPARRLERFLRRCAGSKEIVVGDGLLLRQLRAWLPGESLISLGEALSGLAAVRRACAHRPVRDRAARLSCRLPAPGPVLRPPARTAGCAFNLDLQRIAIPPRRAVCRNAGADSDRRRRSGALDAAGARNVKRIVSWKSAGGREAFERRPGTVRWCTWRIWRMMGHL